MNSHAKSSYETGLNQNSKTIKSFETKHIQSSSLHTTQGPKLRMDYHNLGGSTRRNLNR